MMRGGNRNMRRMMDKMGLDMNELPNVQEVIIKTDKKEIIISKPSVTEMKAKDNTIFQVISDGYEEKELEVARADPARRQRIEQVVAAERGRHGPAQWIDREPDQNEESRKDEEIRDPILAQMEKGLAAPPGGARQPWYSHAANA